MENHICQSPEWAKFKQAYGNKAVHAGGAYFFLTKIPFISKYVGYCPKADLTKVDFAKIKETAKKEGCIFVKFDFSNLYPLSPPSPLRKTKSIFAQETILLDLTPSEEKLLSDMKPKTRYNIRLAEKKGVTVREGKTLQDLEIFLRLQRNAAKRQGFYVHPDEYFRKMWEVLHPAGMIRLLIAEISVSVETLHEASLRDKEEQPFSDGRRDAINRVFTGKVIPIAAWLLFAYDNVLYYPYGGSDYRYRGYMASSLLMWEAIKLGKKLGCRTFDMWGATSNERDPWWGFTNFKLGFGGKMVRFADSVDLVISKPLYYLFNPADRLRWWILKCKSKIQKKAQSAKRKA